MIKIYGLLSIFYGSFSCSSFIDSSGDSDSTSDAASTSDSLSLKQGVVAADSIEIKWTDKNTETLIFEIQICAVSTVCKEEDFTFVKDSPFASIRNSHIESGLKSGTPYIFRIRSITKAGVYSAWTLSSQFTTTLLPPTELKFLDAVTTKNSITISWIPSVSAFDTTAIERCEGANCTDFKPVFGSPVTEETTHEELGLKSSTTYRFRIQALSEKNSSSFIESENVTTLGIVPEVVIPPPPAPSELNIVSLSDTAVQFSWVNNASNSLLNVIERCVGVSCTSFVADSASLLSGSSSSYSATDLSPSTVYKFRIKTISASGSSSYITSSEFKSAPATPASLLTGTVGTSTIQISWTDLASDEDSYEIKRCTGLSCTNFSSIAGSPFAANTTSITDTGLSGSTNYIYQIQSTRDGVKSKTLTSSAIKTTVAAASCSSPKTNIIDRGNKGISTNVGRGLFSDTKFIPGTRQPVVAYYDGSATGGTSSIKVSWWNGTSFQIENVAGDSKVAAGSATWVRLAFLSTGIPMIFWTTGASFVKGAIRSAAFGTVGTWSSNVIDTVAGASSRALEVSVSPLNQVGLVYLTNTTTAGRARFIYCESSCSNLSNFVAMTTVGDTIEASNVIAAYMDTGIAWCRHNATIYYPAVVYPGDTGANVRYASCLGSLSTCKTATGWSGQYINVVATAGVVSKLYIDPTVVGDNPKIISRNAGNTLLQAFQINEACNTTPAAVTAGNTFGAATSGTAWVKLLKSSSGLFHVINNLGTTNVNYHNSVSSNFATSTWNAAGTVDTITLPAAGSGVGGADINNTDGQIYASYGGAAAPFNLILGVVADVSVSSNLASGQFYVLFPDTTGGIQLENTGQTRNVATASTSDGRLAVTYIDSSVGAAAGAVLKYAFRNGTAATVPWVPRILPNTSSPMFPSLVFDHNDHPWISYYDAAAGFFGYYLVTNSSTDGSGDWSFYQFPINAKTASGIAPATDDTAVAMYYSGGVAKPVMVIINSTAAGGAGVRAAMLDTTSSTFVGFSTVDALGASFATRLVATYDKNGNVGISYYDLTNAKAKFNFTTNGLTWFGTSPQITATGTGREGLAIQINPTNTQPAISYYDRANNSLFYTSCTTSFVNCFASIKWTTSTISTSLGISGIAATTNDQLLNTSLTYSASGVPYITYMQGIGATTQSLGVADNSTGSFLTTTLGSSANSAISGAAAVNFSMIGFSASSTRTSSGNFFSAYVGPNNWLYATTCGD
jgi:hypothetical protein